MACRQQEVTHELPSCRGETNLHGSSSLQVLVLLQDEDQSLTRLDPNQTEPRTTIKDWTASGTGSGSNWTLQIKLYLYTGLTEPRTRTRTRCSVGPISCKSRAGFCLETVFYSRIWVTDCCWFWFCWNWFLHHDDDDDDDAPSSSILQLKGLTASLNKGPGAGPARARHWGRTGWGWGDWFWLPF